MAKAPKKTRAQLERYAKELEAQLAFTYSAADADLSTMARKSYMASGLLIEITALGGAQVLRPVVIRDGLSLATIAALRADVAKSYETATAHKPKVEA